MPMIDMAKTPAEVREEQAEWGSPTAIAASVEKYPWGLSISFDQDTLEKLGLQDSLPAVGSIFKFSAVARITSVSACERETSDGAQKSDKNVGAQIVKMSIGDDAPAPRARDWYSAPAAATPDSTTDTD